MDMLASKKIFEDIQNDLDHIYEYFDSISKSGISANNLGYRISEELTGRLDGVRNTMKATLQSYLMADGMSSIRSWSAINKNVFFDSDISKKIVWDIEDNKNIFVHSTFAQKIGVAAALVLILASYIELAISSSDTRYGIALGLTSLSVLIYFKLPAWLNDFDIQRSMKNLRDLISQEKQTLTTWAERVINEYSTELEKVAADIGGAK